jgi:hypothetical protein
MEFTRRTAMKGITGVLGFSALSAASPAVAYAASAARQQNTGGRLSVGLPSRESVTSWIQLVNGRFGPQRLTGDANHRKFVDWLDSQLSSAGFTVKRDTYTFQRWAADAARDVSAWAELPGGKDRRTLDVLSPFAYSGSTSGSGPAVGRAVYVPVGDGTLAQAVAGLLASPPPDLADCVVVVESPCHDSPAATAWGVAPSGLALSAPHVSTPYQWFNPLGATYAELARKCRGIVFCWTNVPDERARWVYAPPSMAPSTATVPAVWVGARTAATLRGLAAKGASIGIRLDARTYPHSPTDTLIATLPGASDEVMAIGSHTDGVNIVEENGALAVLALAKQAASAPRARRPRTLALYLATGHFAGAALTDSATATGPYGSLGADAAGAWRDHPEIVGKTVVALAAEHLGATEWAETSAGFGPTGLPEAQHWFVGSHAAGTTTASDVANQVMADVTLAAGAGHGIRQLRMQVEKTGQASPESSPATQDAIPSMGLIPVPDYMVTASPNGEIDKFDLDIMYTEIQVLSVMVQILNGLSAKQIAGIAPLPPLLKA